MTGQHLRCLLSKAAMVSLALFFVMRADTLSLRRGLEFSGSMYADLGLNHAITNKESGRAEFTGTTVLAFDFRNADREHAKIEGDFELLLPYGAAASAYSALLQSGNIGSSQAYFRLFSVDRSPMLLDMRKLYLECYLPFVDVALGRQIVNFGTGTVFSPLDVFSSVQLSDINFRRNGSDVACLRVPIGTISGVDCIAEAPFANNEHSSAVKAFTTVAGWDMSLVGLYRHTRKEILLGSAVKGDAVVGIRGELAEHLVDGIDNRYFEFMVGTDYSVKRTWFFEAEYYYNERPDAHLSLWSRNNGYASVRCMPNELMQCALSGICQFDDRRMIGIASWYYSLLQNTDLTAYVRGYNNMSGFGVLDVQYAVRVTVKF